MTTILTAVVTGVLVLLGGNLPWAGFGPISAAPPPLVWERGVDASFVLTAVVFVVLAVLTGWAYWGVRKLRERAARQAG